MTNRSPQPPATCQPYGMVRAGSGEVVVATPNHSPSLTRISVGGRGKNETTDQEGKDAR
jgi:hypothetical protein